MRAEEQLIRLLRKCGETTRPQMAQATGLSLVTIGKLVAQLERGGLLQKSELVSSGGGRPVQLYRFNPHASYHALFRCADEGACQRGTLEIVNLLGEVVQRETSLFTRLQPSNADDWLDAARRRRPFRSITLYGAPVGMAEHLKVRYACPINEPDSATALSEEREGTLTLLLQRGQHPQACLYRSGEHRPCGSLGLLPQPMSWKRMDYDDHTLLEEMSARLLLMLICILCPERIVFYADCWTERLISRLRYNLATKLRGQIAKPTLHFCPLSEPRLAAALAEYASQH